MENQQKELSLDTLRFRLSEDLLSENKNPTILIIDNKDDTYSLQILIPLKLDEDTCFKVLPSTPKPTDIVKKHWRDAFVGDELCDIQNKKVTIKIKEKSGVPSDDGKSILNLTAEIKPKIPGTGAR